MPTSPPRPCTAPNCGRLVYDGSGRCAQHPKQAWTKKATAAKRITGRALQKARAELFAKRPLCAACSLEGVVTLASQRDHIVSLEQGGRDVESNTQGLCIPCHDLKSKRERAAGRWGAYREPQKGEGG